MKFYIKITILIIFSQSIIFAKDELDLQKKYILSSESFGFYNQLARRSFSYGFLLVEKLEGPSAKNIKIDLAATAFNYFLMRQDNLIEKDYSLEVMMKEVFSKKVMSDILADPLNWYGDGIARGLKQPMVHWNVERNKDHYSKKIQEFKLFLNE